MICEKIIGNLKDPDFSNKKVDYIDLDWHETYNKINRKKSRNGKDVAIQLDDSVLHTGLKPGDIIGIEDDGSFIAVDINATEVLIVNILEMNTFNIAKAAYEIGNCHAPLFQGTENNQLVTIFNEPMEHILSHLNFVKTERKVMKLDFTKQISSIVGHGHHHH